MKLQMVFTGAVCAALMGVAPLASADSMSLNSFKGNVLPVLITVSDQGKITSMSPAYPLRPYMQRLVRGTLDQMITGPAMYHGKAISSQAVIKLALQATPEKDGKYQAKFAYAGAMPVPYGSWYWNHIDGHRLALVNENMRSLSRPHRRMIFDRAPSHERIPARRGVHRSHVVPASQRHINHPVPPRSH